MRPLKAFLCHASGDKNLVRELYKRLTFEGVDAWLDKEKLLPGQDWRMEIPKAVREADVVVVCLSNKSVTKEGYVQKEIKFALDIAEEKPEGTIFLIPARLEDCPVPERLSRWQWVDLYEENGFIQLLRSLKLRAEAVGATVEPTLYVDPDKETERRLEQWYTEGLAAFYTEDWDRACQRLQSILSERPNHKHAAEKLAEAERQRDLSRLYEQASVAVRSEEWESAIRILEELSRKSAEYKDAAQLLRDARKQKQLRDLYAEAKALHAGQQWEAVVKVFAQISLLEPNYPDADGLLPSAQKEVTELKRLADLNDQYSRALHEMDAGNWYEARRLLEAVHKSQTKFLETEKLLKKVEGEIARDEQKRRQNDQVNTLYEQAHGLLRSKKWRNALDKMEEIRKLDERFPDTDGIAEKAQKELAREEQEAERQNKLAALYAEAVKLLKEEKYQEALDKWGEVRAVDPKYPDRQWVARTAKRRVRGVRIPVVAQKDNSLRKIFLKTEPGGSTTAQVRTVWVILLFALSWGLGRFGIEALARITDFFWLGLTFWATEIILGAIGLLYGVTIWLLLRFLNLRIDGIKTILLLAGWLAGFLVVPVVGWSVSGRTDQAWDIGYLLAGVIAGLCTVMVLRSVGILPNLRQFFILVTGISVAVYAGEQIFDTLGLIKTVDIVSLEASPQFGAGSFFSGLFCAWIMTIFTGNPQNRSRRLVLFFTVLALLVVVGFLPQLIQDQFAGAVGQWEAADIFDKSHMILSITRSFSGEYKFVFYDQHAGVCNGGSGNAQFSGRPIGNKVTSSITFVCTLNPDLRHEVEYAFSYEVDVDRLVDSSHITWNRMK